MMYPRSNTYRRTRSIGTLPSGKEEEQEHPWGKFAWRTANLCIMVTIATIVLYYQIKNRPMITDTYHTSNPWDNNRRGAIYTCGCSLPTSLQGPEDMSPPSSTRNISLNICYDESLLETVTILMYSNSAAVKVETIINDSMSSIVYHTRTVEGGGYSVTQEAHDIDYATNDKSGDMDSKNLLSWNPNRLNPESLKYLKDLYRGGYPEEDVYYWSDVLYTAEAWSFSNSYVRVSFRYYCYSCNSCGLDKVNNAISTVVNKKEIWAGCFYWNMDDGIRDACNLAKGMHDHLTSYAAIPFPNNSYGAKCLLYPTETLPTTFALKSFFSNFSGLHQIQIIPNRTVFNESFANGMVLWQPSFLYLNISKVEKSSIQFGFVELTVGSALWTSLSTTFPNLDTQCSDVQEVQVCNGTSLCNLFSNGGSYRLRSVDMENKSNCLEILKDASLVNYLNHTADGNPLSISNWHEVMCRDFSCQNVTSYKANWNKPPIMDGDALNQFLYSRSLSDEWAQRSGLCKINYTDVFRYMPEGPSGTTIFLHTNCTQNTVTNGNMIRTGKYCWLTGYYHFLNDTPEDREKHLSEDLFSHLDRSFVCYRVETQRLFPWFIVTFGILFGWLGTVQLILHWFMHLGEKFFRKDNDHGEGNDDINSHGSVTMSPIVTSSRAVNMSRLRSFKSSRVPPE